MKALRPDRRILLAAAALMIAAGGYTLWWRGVANRVENHIPEVLAAAAVAGIAVNPGEVQIGGFPYRVEVALTDPVVSTRGWRWAPRRVRLFVQPWNLRHIVVLAGTEHRVGQAATALTAEVVRASVVRDRDGALVRASVEAVEVTTEQGALDRLELHLRRTASELDVAGRLEGVRWTGSGGQGRPVLKHVLLEAQMTPHPGLAVLAGPTGWALDGGVLEISRLSFAWGALSGEADGAVTLDAEGRPLGAFALRVDSAPTALRFLEDQGWTSPATTRAAEEALANIAHVLGIPVTAQEGFLGVAGVPLVRIPSLTPGSRISPARTR